MKKLTQHQKKLIKIAGIMEATFIFSAMVAVSDYPSRLAMRIALIGMTVSGLWMFLFLLINKEEDWEKIL